MRALTSTLLALALTCPFTGCASDSGDGGDDPSTDVSQGDGEGTTGDGVTGDDATTPQPDGGDTDEPAPEDTTAPAPDGVGPADDVTPSPEDTPAPPMDAEPSPEDTTGPEPMDVAPGTENVIDPTPGDTTPAEDGGGAEEDAVCVPDCAGKTCGADGCGGSCGECGPEDWCVNDECVPLGGCIPNCTGKECGSDGCDGICGVCDLEEICKAGGVCGLPSTGTETCIDVYNCIAQCGLDALCAEGCAGQASEEALAELDVLSTCQQGCPAQDMSCLMDVCVSELAACAYEASGVASCMDMFTCLQVCDVTDATCQTTCIEQGSPEAQAQFMAIQLCLQVECPNQDTTCVQTAAGIGGACQGYVDTCFAP